MNKENKNYSYQYPKGDKEILAKIMDPNYQRGNLGLPENASPEERLKYRIGKAILTYQQDNRLTLTEVAHKLNINETKFYDLCRGQVNAFALSDLVAYLEKLSPQYELRITKAGFMERN